MASLYIVYRNIYENSTVTVTTEDSDYPEWRLYDRDIGKMYKGTSTATHLLKADQGATTIWGVDTCLVSAGHNLDVGDDTDVFLQSSDNDSVWSTAASGVNIATTAMIAFELGAAEDHRYWRVKLNALGANPEIPEIFIGEKIEFENCILYGDDEGKKGNVERMESISGIPNFLQQGVEREYRRYRFFLRTDTQRTNMEDFLTHSRNKPFWIKDLDGEWYFMSLVEPNIGPLSRPLINRYEIEVEMIEVPQ